MALAPGGRTMPVNKKITARGNVTFRAQAGGPQDLRLFVCITILILKLTLNISDIQNPCSR